MSDSPFQYPTVGEYGHKGGGVKLSAMRDVSFEVVGAAVVLTADDDGDGVDVAAVEADGLDDADEDDGGGDAGFVADDKLDVCSTVASDHPHFHQKSFGYDEQVAAG